jgi:hypothetical protein
VHAVLQHVIQNVIPIQKWNFRCQSSVKDDIGHSFAYYERIKYKSVRAFSIVPHKHGGVQPHDNCAASVIDSFIGKTYQHRKK